MRHVYLVLAVLGAALPYAFFTQFVLGPDPSLDHFLRQSFANPSAGGLTTDLLITSVVFWLWSFGEARRRGMRRWWPYVLVNLTIGLSCAFPLFLYVRERAGTERRAVTER